MFNKLRIGNKLILSFGGVILLLLALTVVMAYSHSRITHSTNGIVTLFEDSERVNRAINAANQMRRHYLLYLTTRDPRQSEEFDVWLKNSIAITEDVRDHAKDPQDHHNSEEILAVLHRLGEQRTVFLRLENKIADLRSQCDTISISMTKGIEDTLHNVHEMVKKTSATNDTGEQVVEMSKVNLEKSLLDCEIIARQVISARINFVNSLSELDRKDYEKQLHEAMSRLTKSFEDIKPLLPPGEIPEKFVKVMRTRQSWKDTTDNYIATVKSLNNMQEPLMADVRSLIALADKLLENNAAATTAEFQHQNQLVAMSKYIGYTTSVLAILLAIAMGWVLTRSIVRGITEIIKIFHKITTEGDVTMTIDDAYLTRGDEIGELAQQAQAIIGDYRSVIDAGQTAARGDWTYKVQIKGEKDKMNKNIAGMFDQVNEVLQQVHGAVHQVSAGASQVSSASDTLSYGATKSASSLEEITSSMTEMGTQTHQNAQNATEASHLAKDASSVANSGQGMMKQMINSMEQITKNSQNVQKVVKVIDDIAFQTNLLALNAAVEAARAGVHGKGFAVVAEEVRNLAARCAKAAGETTQMIENNNRQITEGAEIAEKTAEMLDLIVTQVANTTNLINEIAKASNEQAQGVSQVTQALQQIDSVTQQNSASAEETASVSSDMNNHVNMLLKVMSRFKLRNAKSQSRTLSLPNPTFDSKQPRTESNTPFLQEFASVSSSPKSKAAQSFEQNGPSIPADNWGGVSATAVLPDKSDIDRDYNFKLDDSEFGRY